MGKIELSKKELDIMLVFWNSAEPLAATDIPKINPLLNINTVQVALKNLLSKSYIKVGDIVYHGTVLTRTFVPTLSQEQYLLAQLKHTKIKMSSFIATLVKKEDNVEALTELENIIKEQKNKLDKGDD